MAWLAKPVVPRGKYGNRKTVVDGIAWASAKQAKRYGELKLLLKADRIRNLRWEVTYPLVVNGVLVCNYRADFVYEEFKRTELSPARERQVWAFVVEDVKGVRTKDYIIKRKLMKAVHRIEIMET